MSMQKTLAVVGREWDALCRNRDAVTDLERLERADQLLDMWRAARTVQRRQKGQS